MYLKILHLKMIEIVLICNVITCINHYKSYQCFKNYNKKLNEMKNNEKMNLQQYFTNRYSFH